MTDALDTLPNAELSERTALALGWRKDESRGWLQPYDCPSGALLELECADPAFAESFDACLGPGGPWEDAIRHGWRMTLSPGLGQPIVNFAGVVAVAPTIPRAVCIAYLKATQAAAARAEGGTAHLDG